MSPLNINRSSTSMIVNYDFGACGGDSFILPKTGATSFLQHDKRCWTSRRNIGREGAWNLPPVTKLRWEFSMIRVLNDQSISKKNLIWRGHSIWFAKMSILGSLDWSQVRSLYLAHSAHVHMRIYMIRCIVDYHVVCFTYLNSQPKMVTRNLSRNFFLKRPC